MGDALKDAKSSSAVVDDISALRPRKRRRTRKACDDCRRRKVKCDGASPCKACVDFGEGTLSSVPSPVTEGAPSQNGMPLYTAGKAETHGSSICR
jgi:hypothetical protein